MQFVEQLSVMPSSIHNFVPFTGFQGPSERLTNSGTSDHFRRDQRSWFRRPLAYFEGLVQRVYARRISRVETHVRQNTIRSLRNETNVSELKRRVEQLAACLEMHDFPIQETNSWPRQQETPC